MRDFTLPLLEKLLQTILDSGYTIVSFQQFISNPASHQKSVILRHDVDAYPGRALALAEIEQRLGIGSTYYLRCNPAMPEPTFIKKLLEMGNEIGYHYEDFSACHGHPQKAIESFSTKLRFLRNYAPIKTICMHGSPLSVHDNRNLWNYYRYTDFALEADVYLDSPFEQMAYFTDTGRNWNNQFNIRDKVSSPFHYDIRSTSQLIEHFEKDMLPPWVMITIHPQRWTNGYLPWIAELIFQNIRNIAKILLWQTRKTHAQERQLYHY